MSESRPQSPGPLWLWSRSPGARWCRTTGLFPDTLCMKKCVQRQKSDGPLVSSQEERALFVRLINRGETAYRPRVKGGICSPVCLNGISVVRASGKTFRRRFFDALESTGDPGQLGKRFCWDPVVPDPALPPRHAPRPDPPLVCPGLGFDMCFQKTIMMSEKSATAGFL